MVVMIISIHKNQILLQLQIKIFIHLLFGARLGMLSVKSLGFSRAFIKVEPIYYVIMQVSLRFVRLKNIILLCSFLAFLSCHDDREENLVIDNDSIAFEVDTQTKGESVDNSTIANFGVFAYYTGLKQWNEVSAFITPNYIYNQKVERRKVDAQWSAWGYNPIMYWPRPEEKLSFFAYSPFATDKNGIIVSAGSAVGAPELEYSVPVIIQDQQDLLFSHPLLDKSKVEYNNGTIQLDFEHALTQITYQAKLIDGQSLDPGSEVRINCIVLANLFYKGNLHFEPLSTTNKAKWNIDTQLKTSFESNTELEFGIVDVALNTSYQQICKPGSALLLLPQNLAGATIKIDYTLSNADGSVESIQKSIELSSFIDELPMGKNILFKILLGIEKEDPGILDVDVLPWDSKFVAGDFSATFLNLSAINLKEPCGMPIKVYYDTDYKYHIDVNCIKKPATCVDFIVDTDKYMKYFTIPGTLPAGQYEFEVVAGGLKRILRLEILPQLPINEYYYENYAPHNSANCLLIPITSNRSFKLHIGRIDEYWLSKDDSFGGNNNENTIDYNSSWEPEIIWADFDVSNYHVNIRRDINSELNAVYLDFRDVDNLLGRKGGNLVFGIKGNEGDILWSWHVWITDLVTFSGNNIIYNLETPVSVLASKAEIANAFKNESQRVDMAELTFSSLKSFVFNGADNLEKIVLDRNIGARFAQVYGDDNSDTYGLFYKFGMKDPLPMGIYHVSDRKEPIVYRKNKIGRLNDGAAFISHPYTTSTKMSRDYYINNPTTMSALNHNNIIVENKIHQYWNKVEGVSIDPDNAKGQKTIYDPSPHGWRVPWGKDWTNLGGDALSLWSYSYRYSSSYKCSLNGYRTNANKKSFWFPCAGDRSSLVPANGNLVGIYWSGHATTTNNITTVHYLKLYNNSGEPPTKTNEASTSKIIGVVRPVIDN